MSSAENSAGGASDARDYFFSLCVEIEELLRGDEMFTCALRAEDSGFIRFNRSRVGQAGEVRQRELDLDWIRGRRHARGRLTISGERAVDLPQVVDLVSDLREMANASPEDPYLTVNTDLSLSSERVDSATEPAPAEVVDAVGESSTDLVGIYAAGGVQRAFASSLGQRNWHSSTNFNFDWSLFDRNGRAVKGAYAGFDWDGAELRARIESARGQLAVLGRRARGLAPGRYRVYLAPAAMHEVMAILSWGGFGLRDKMTKASPFLRLHEGAAALSPQVHVSEDIAGGIAPSFESAGFCRPARIPLIAAGEFASCLVSPRSGVEFGVENNAADQGESPVALELAAGTLDLPDIASELGSGIVISNLWYLNFSDRAAGRITGMTRYATLWVENGEIQGPVEPMRFDDSVYRILGDNLVGLTRERELIMDPDTYEWRSLRSARLPGALVDDFALTL